MLNLALLLVISAVAVTFPALAGAEFLKDEKGTLTINIANYLANKENKKILIIDLDPQFNATQALLLKQEKNKLSNNINKQDKDEVEFKAEVSSAEQYKKLSKNGKTAFQIFHRTVITKNTQKDIIYEFSENISFVPGDLELSSVIAGDTASKVGLIDQFIKINNLKEKFDFILIDCPPTWSILTHSALYASKYYLIPSKLDFYSSIGINSLQNKISEKLTNDCMYQETSRKLFNLGIVFSMTTNLQSEKRLRETVIKDYDTKIHVFDAEIPLIPSASSSFLFYSEVENNKTYSNLSNSFEKIMSEFISQITNYEEELDNE